MEGRTGAIEAIRAKAKDSNINPESLLATDYLNHFNEPMMLLELVPDMPECIDDLAEWAPISYAEHFRRTNFAARDLAVEAYNLSPPEYRRPFDAAIRKLCALLTTTIAGARSMVARGDGAAAADVIHFAMPAIRHCQATAAAIINGAVVADAEAPVEDAAGGENTLDQSEIDTLLKG